MNRNRRPPIALLILVLVTTGATFSEDLDSSNAGWPKWRGADSTGASSATGVFPADGFELSVRWRQQLGSGYSAIVIRDGHAITSFSDGERDFVVNLDADSGAERWRYPLAPTFPGREGANDGPVSTPAIDENTVYAIGPYGDLVALSLAQGELLWHVQLVDELDVAVPHWGVSTSPLVHGDHVIVATGGSEGAVTAFDRKNGKVVWRNGADDVNYQSPLIWESGERQLLVASGDTTLFFLDPKSGRERATFRHGGSGFYRRIVNPLPAGPGQLLLNNERMQSTLVELLNKDSKLQVVPRWTSRDLKRSYSPPVFSDGHFYGFNGGFLSSVDAATGELNWKSRPPGDGFHILVDGHLVVLTKRGSLHIAAARPDQYSELASLKVLPHISWTPPSFAEGRIYVRDSFADVVAVDVVPQKSGPTATEITTETSVPQGLLPETEFARWVASLSSADDKDAAIREYLAQHTEFPIGEDGRRVHFVYHGSADDVAIRGGMLGSRTELAMHRVPDTDLFFASFELPVDARIQYQFVRNLDEPVVDPLNPRRGDSRLYPGLVSLYIAPGADEGPPSSARASGIGRIETHHFESPTRTIGTMTWGGKRNVSVYLPHGYDRKTTLRYPTVYVLLGQRMLDQAKLAGVFDAMNDGTTKPVIGVFVGSNSAYEHARSQRYAHAEMVVDDLVPWIDDRYRTLTNPDSRAVTGIDEPGYAAVEMALRYPGTFNKAGGQSVLAIARGAQELLDLVDTSSATALDIYLDWGRLDHSNDATETDIPAFGRQLRDQLLAAGHTVSGREWNDSSDFPIWAWRYEHLLRSLFYESESPGDR